MPAAPTGVEVSGGPVDPYGFGNPLLAPAPGDLGAGVDPFAAPPIDPYGLPSYVGGEGVADFGAGITPTTDFTGITDANFYAPPPSMTDPAIGSGPGGEGGFSGYNTTANPFDLSDNTGYSPNPDTATFPTGSMAFNPTSVPNDANLFAQDFNGIPTDYSLLEFTVGGQTAPDATEFTRYQYQPYDFAPLLQSYGYNDFSQLNTAVQSDPLGFLSGAEAKGFDLSPLFATQGVNYGDWGALPGEGIDYLQGPYNLTGLNDYNMTDWDFGAYNPGLTLQQVGDNYWAGADPAPFTTDGPGNYNTMGGWGQFDALAAARKAQLEKIKAQDAAYWAHSDQIQQNMSSSVEAFNPSAAYSNVTGGVPPINMSGAPNIYAPTGIGGTPSMLIDYPTVTPIITPLAPPII